jgi:hypothetical protein
MKVLIDENLPKRLHSELPGHAAFTVSDQGWNSKSNGELLSLMSSEHFDVLLTFDRNLQYQQNLSRYSVTIIVLVADDNAYETLKPLLPKVRELLAGDISGVVEVVAP